MINKVLMLTFALFSSSVFAWSGFDYTNGCFIEIESYDHGYSGEGEVVYFDYCSGDYKYGYLDLYSGGSGTIIDYDSGDYLVIEMD